MSRKMVVRRVVHGADAGAVAMVVVRLVDETAL